MTTTTPAADGAVKLDLVRYLLDAYVPHLGPHTATVALWAAWTNVADLSGHAPRLVLTRGRGCRVPVLDVLAAFVHAPVRTDSASVRSALHTVAVTQGTPPTLLVPAADGDVYARTDAPGSDLREVLRAGFERRAPFLRYDATRRAVERVPTFAPAVVTFNGPPAPSVADRGITVPMDRSANRRARRFPRGRAAAGAHVLGDVVREWARAHAREFVQARPELPAAAGDRAGDVWRPLLALADVAGGHWPTTARHAATHPADQ